MGRMDVRRGLSWLSFMLLGASGASADSLALLHPIADAYVIGDPALLDTNFGADTQIIAWANYPYFGGRSYVAFDLSGVPAGETVTFARLNLFQWNGGGYASGVDVFRVADDGWQEDAITWNNQPVQVPTIDDLIAQDPSLIGYARGWVSFDLLQNGVWDPDVDLVSGDGRLTLIIRITGGEVNTQRSHNFCSREGGPFDCLTEWETGAHPGRSPQLIIGTPEPASAAMLGAGIAALAGLAARRGRRCERDRVSCGHDDREDPRPVSVRRRRL